MITAWRCIPCGATSNTGPLCGICGRRREDATDAARWASFFALDAEIADAECAHEHVEKDDDGRDRWFYVCVDCDRVVVLTEPDEDGHSHWEVLE